MAIKRKHGKKSKAKRSKPITPNVPNDDQIAAIFEQMDIDGKSPNDTAVADNVQAVVIENSVYLNQLDLATMAELPVSLLSEQFDDLKSLVLVQKSNYMAGFSEIGRYLFFSNYKSDQQLETNFLEINSPVTTAQVTWLVPHLSRLKSLSFYFVDYLTLEQCVQLLGQCQQLVSLQIFCTEAQKQQFYHPKLLMAIYSLTTLKQLYLPFNFDARRQTEMMGQIVDRLELYFYHDFAPFTSGTDDPIGDPEVLQMSNISEQPTAGQVGVYLAVAHIRFLQCSEKRPNVRPSIENTGTMGKNLGFGYYYTKTSSAPTTSTLDFHAEMITEFIDEKRNQLTHFELELPAEAHLESALLTQLARLTKLSHLRLTTNCFCTSEDPPMAQSSRLFSKCWADDYRNRLWPTLPQVRHLALARFRITDTSEIDPEKASIGQCLVHLFPNAKVIHFENCTFDSNEQYYLELFTVGFLRLSEVWQDNKVVLQIERAVQGETTQQTKEREERMKEGIRKLFCQRFDFDLMHQMLNAENSQVEDEDL